MQLSIVLPAYNEGPRLGVTLERVIEFARRDLDDFEIVVVDDGSSDNTAAVAGSFSGVRVLCNETNLGKGNSVRRGVLAARKDPVLFTDADLSTPISEALALLEAIENGADVAIGSRREGSGKVVSRSPYRKLQAELFRSVVKLLVLRGVHDTQCGFKMFRQAAARRIFSLQRIDGWAFDVEVLFIARKLGYRIAEVPIEWRASGESRLGRFSPFEMVRDLLRIRRHDRRGLYDPAGVSENCPV